MLKMLSCLCVVSQVLLYGDISDSRLGGIKIDSSIGPAVSLHQTIDLRDNNGTSKKILLVGTEIGPWGGKLQAGYGHFDYLSIFGKLSLMRTWNSPPLLDSGQTYLGAEIQFTALIFNVSFGFYQNIGGDNDAKQQIGSASIGIGW